MIYTYVRRVATAGWGLAGEGWGWGWKTTTLNIFKKLRPLSQEDTTQSYNIVI